LTASSDVNYDEVTKTHNMQFCALVEGTFNLKKNSANENVLL